MSPAAKGLIFIVVVAVAAFWAGWQAASRWLNEEYSRLLLEQHRRFMNEREIAHQQRMQELGRLG